MSKISITVGNGYLAFSKFTKGVNDEDLNNTNIIDTKNIKFTEDYILENLELVSAFLNLIIVKFEIKKVKIKHLEISECVLKLIKIISNIEEVIFTEDSELNYTISSLLLENRNLNSIECYSLPEIMFYRFPSGIINTRCEYLFFSNFMKDNSINTYSELCNKDKILVNGNITLLENEELNYFFNKNKNLRRIYINDYSYESLLVILNLLKKNNIKSINIIICEKSDNTNIILKDIELFGKLSKEYNVRIKIKYSKEYKEKNKIKEVNINLFRMILILIIIILCCIIFFTEKKEVKDGKNTKENIDMINDVIEQVYVEEMESYDEVIPSTNDDADSNNSSTYISPYYQNYDKVYNKLLSINNDTVGWLTINNTNINYPVVQTIDNNYYLKHAYDKSNNQAGWIFVDYRNDLDNLNQNIIIYGHNVIKNDVMFGSLKYVLNPNWYNNEDNLKVVFNIKDKSFIWQVFSIYVIDKTTDYLYTDFGSSDEFLEFINLLKSRSIHDFDVNFSENDKIITLSTCHETNDRRLVLHAKLMQ